MSRREQATDTVYCDRLTRRSAAALVAAAAARVVVLEALDARQQRIADTLQRRGIDVSEADFFAGRLRTPDDEPLYVAARRQAGVVAVRLAAQVVRDVPALRLLNEKYGRDTVRLALAKQLAFPVETMLARVLAASALSAGECTVWMAAPALFDGEAAVSALEGVRVRFYPAEKFGARRMLRGLGLALARRARSMLVPARARRHTQPSVLCVHEDEVHMDRSRRGQPHWVLPDDPPPYRTFIAPRGRTPPASDAAGLSDANVTELNWGDMAAARREFRRHEGLRSLRRDAWRCFRAAARTRVSGERNALVHTWLLLLRAEELGALAARIRARVFVFGDAYFIESDAMQIAGCVVPITTVAYQYSNLPLMSPLMLNTADRMVLFSDLYQPLWQHDGIRPVRMDTAGYVYDIARDRVRERAAEMRARLEQAGASYVICYFDESVQQDRWGWVHQEDHHAELTALARLILDDPTTAVIVKSQFERNSPSRLYAHDATLAAARSTGRFVELVQGRHRNIVFPVEAALASDLAIGHLLGATASLEAALAGVRSVLIDERRLRTAFDSVYARADIVHSSMEAVLAAVAGARRGDTAHASLGDWTPIARSFDPYRDGQAAVRLRAIIEEHLSDQPLVRQRPSREAVA